MAFTMTFNGNVLPIKVKAVYGRGVFSNEITARSVAGADGSFYIRQRIPSKELVVDFDILTDGIEDIRDQIDNLNELLETDGPAPIVFSDEPEYTRYGIISGEPDEEEMFYKYKGSITLFCANPFKYKAETSVPVTSGVAFSLDGGNRAPQPTLTATFTDSASEYKVTDVNGDFILVTYPFVATDVLEIDFRYRKITINGTVQMTALSFTSEWFKFKKGSNTLTIDQNAVTTNLISFEPASK